MTDGDSRPSINPALVARLRASVGVVGAGNAAEWGPDIPVLEFLLARAVEDSDAVARFQEAWDSGSEAEEVWAYLAHFNLRRAKADVNARLNLIMLHRPGKNGHCRTCGEEERQLRSRPSYPCETLVRLLWQYQHHPDIDDRWGAGDRPPVI